MKQPNPDKKIGNADRVPPIPLAIAQLLFASLLLYLSNNPIDLSASLTKSSQQDAALVITIPITAAAIASPIFLTKNPTVSRPNPAYQN